MRDKVGRGEEHADNEGTNKDVGARFYQLLRRGDTRHYKYNGSDRYFKRDAERKEQRDCKIEIAVNVGIHLDALRRYPNKKREHNGEYNKMRECDT